jgi:hypothetical protein
MSAMMMWQAHFALEQKVTHIVLVSNEPRGDVRD